MLQSIGAKDDLPVLNGFALISESAYTPVSLALYYGTPVSPRFSGKSHLRNRLLNLEVHKADNCSKFGQFLFELHKDRCKSFINYRRLNRVISCKCKNKARSSVNGRSS